MIVADTNLIAYLMIRSDLTDAAREVFRRDPAWAAPMLWRSEFRNELSLYLRQGNLGIADALAYMEQAEELLQGWENQVPSGAVLSLSMGSGCSAYDCEFVHLAQELGAVLVTSDKRVLRAFSETAVSMQAFIA